MEIQDNQINDVVIINFTGNIDAITAPKITEYIKRLITKGNIKLIADFNNVPYTSSAGLRVLLAAVKETRSQKGDMRLANIQPDVLKVLALTGFTNILKIFSDVEEAVQSYS